MHRLRPFGPAPVPVLIVMLFGIVTAHGTAGRPMLFEPPQSQRAAPQHRPSGPIRFKSVLALNQNGDVAPQLRGGRVAVSRDWPASLFTSFSTPDGTAVCTAALIGPHVVLTAAHCVPTSGDVTFQFPGRDVPYALTCTAHPDYVKETDVSADYALCVTKTPLVAPSGFLYETVNTSSSTMQELLRNQATIILSGYGCISDIVANDDIDEKYRIGFNSLDEISTSPTRRRGAEYYSPRQVNNLFTKADPNKANLCPGDSGGPAFRRTGGTDQFSRRVIVGVNSRVFFTDESETRYGSSMISATGGPAFRGWAEQWAIEAGVAACGLHGAVPNCRT